MESDKESSLMQEQRKRMALVKNGVMQVLSKFS